ncbi:MAG: trypsin-like peptidase domain-containing protein [Planctomycetota bacterium]
MLGLRILCLCLLAISWIASVARAQAVGDCVALEFVNTGCPNCRVMDQAVEESLQHGWAVRRIDVASDPYATARWRIHSTPTTLLIRDGREVDRILGPVAFDELQRRMMAASSRIASNPGLVPTAASFSLQPVNKRAPPENTNPEPSATRPDLRPDLRADGSELARRATVRIRVDEPTSQAVGTGTIIHTYQDDALVITCGHLFRGTGPRPNISVELLDGANAVAYPAQLVHYEAGDKDIGLISFRPGRAVACAPIAGARRVREGDPVFSIGCDNGNDPSRRNSRVTKLNRYLGAPNIEVAGMPVQGRSGGGLFNEFGELIGICYAADQELDEGLYSGLEIIHEQVANLGLDSLLRPASSTVDRTPEPPSKSITLILREGDRDQGEMQIRNPSPALLQALAQEGYAVAR